MVLVIKELAERFIEFVLSVVKGDTTEDKLISALKSCALLMTILGSACIWLGIAYFNTLIVVKDMEVGLDRVNELFDRNGENSISIFVTMNQRLTQEVNKTKDDNILLLSGISKLAEENKWLRDKLNRNLENTLIVKEEYKQLLGFCIPAIKNNKRDN